MPQRARAVRRTAAVVVGVVVLAVATVAYLVRDPSPVGYWRSTEGRQAFDRAYDAALATMPAPTRVLDLPTTFGTVHVLEFAGQARDPGAVPALLVPGRASAGPMWSQNLPALAAERPVYVVDPIGDAGLSVQTRELTGAADQAQWLDETLVGLRVPTVHLVGHSFGGWAAANYAIRRPDRVATLALLEPVRTVAGLRLGFVLSTVPSALGLGGLAAAEDAAPGDPVAAMIAAGARHHAAKLPLPEQPSADDLARLTMPVFVGLAGRSEVHDGGAAAAAAERDLPAATVRLWPDATHSLPMEEADEVDAALIALMR
ncbi:alpha/beta fold hydrolase [Actinomycetospora termitidis]|uniref:Alpha/beta fold hydrolase n=1 Tax=Actinomycetospora termitidis TaxID=3053470 RepID=A0ABT7MI69_9PSEU|nr:alpha/beta hydrolase [Actinomycetospora sp. Odt1-22]MDL5160351.1 alpha/beta fold hydrolase [Actinomycetospora sp. Odt1-22]